MRLYVGPHAIRRTHHRAIYNPGYDEINLKQGVTHMKQHTASLGVFTAQTDGLVPHPTGVNTAYQLNCLLNSGGGELALVRDRHGSTPPHHR